MFCFQKKKTQNKKKNKKALLEVVFGTFGLIRESGFLRILCKVVV